MLLSPGRISDWLYEAGAVSIPVFVCCHLHVEALTVPTVLLLIPKYAMQIKQHTGSLCVCVSLCLCVFGDGAAGCITINHLGFICVFLAWMPAEWEWEKGGRKIEVTCSSALRVLFWI